MHTKHPSWPVYRSEKRNNTSSYGTGANAPCKQIHLCDLATAGRVQSRDGRNATNKVSEAAISLACNKKCPGCGFTSHKIQMRWSPPRTMGSEMGTVAETSTSRETPNEPSSRNERACQTKGSNQHGGIWLSIHVVGLVIHRGRQILDQLSGRVACTARTTFMQ